MPALAEAGVIHHYNHGLDKIRMSKGTRPLKPFNSETSIGSCLTVADPIIQKLAQKNEADIFTSDVALSALMCAPKAQFAWDIVLNKFANFVFIDKRDAENILDWQTIAETAQADYQSTDDDSINGTRALMAEATRICKSWQVAALRKEKSVQLKEDDPHIEDESQIAARVGYVYKLWKIKTKGISRRICVRCAVHSMNEVTNERMNLYAFHEW